MKWTLNGDIDTFLVCGVQLDVQCSLKAHDNELALCVVHEFLLISIVPGNYWMSDLNSDFRVLSLYKWSISFCYPDECEHSWTDALRWYDLLTVSDLHCM